MKTYSRNYLVTAMAMVIGFCTYADISTIEHSLPELYEQVKLSAQLVPDRMIIIEQPSELLGLISRALDSDDEAICGHVSREMLTDCMYALRNGSAELPLSSLMQIMPALIEYASHKVESFHKAVRPDTGDNGTISGCSAPCDNSAIVRLLNQIRIELAECCADIERSFQETWTILAAIEFNGIFTVLEDIRSTLTECCAEIDRDFNATWTILANGFGDTFTVLQDIRSTLTECCAEIDRDLSGVFTVLENLGCGQVLQITAPTTIAAPGIYCVANQINGSIVIESSNVVLDLNQQFINGIGTDLIRVNGPVENIEIKNGTLLNGAGSTGIVLAGNIVNILISDIQISNSAGAVRALDITRVFGGLIKNLSISSGSLSSSAVVVNTFFPQEGVEFQNVTIENISFGGSRAFDLSGGGGPININDCLIINNLDLAVGIFIGNARVRVNNVEIRANNNLVLLGEIRGILTGGGIIDIIVENCTIANNLASDGSEGIRLVAVDRAIVRNNLIEANGSVVGRGVGIRVDVSAINCIVDSNTLNSNVGSLGGDGILFIGINGTNTIIRNVVYGHSINFSMVPPLPPIITYDISANTVTPVPATVTSYHNLSTVL